MKPYQDKISIKAWAEEDRPREKIKCPGPPRPYRC